MQYCTSAICMLSSVTRGVLVTVPLAGTVVAVKGAAKSKSWYASLLCGDQDINRT